MAARIAFLGGDYLGILSEWRLTRQAPHSTTTAQSLDGCSFRLAFFYVLVAFAAASILTFLPIIAFAAAFPKWRPCPLDFLFDLA